MLQNLSLGEYCIVKCVKLYTIHELLENIPTEQEMNDYLNKLIKTFEEQG